jgi:toxin YoeB
MFRLEYQKLALKQIKNLKQNPILLKKLSIVLKNISTDPYSPEHKFERLKHNLTGYCSKRLDQKNRIIYQVKDSEVVVLVISIIGHYGD